MLPPPMTRQAAVAAGGRGESELRGPNRIFLDGAQSQIEISNLRHRRPNTTPAAAEAGANGCGKPEVGKLESGENHKCGSRRGKN